MSGICEKCHFKVQWRVSVTPIGSTKMIRVCESCAEEIQDARDAAEREPRDVTFDEALGHVCGERERQADAMRLKR